MTRFKIAEDDFEAYGDGELLEGALGDLEWEATLSGACVVRVNPTGSGYGFDVEGSAEQGSLAQKEPSGFESWGPDQYAKIDVLALGSYSPGVLARGDADNSNDYEVTHTASGAVEIAEHSSGVWSNLATSSAGSVAAGDTLSIEVKGTRIDGLVNGSSVVNTTDSTLADGDPGVYAYTYNGDPTGDNFEAGRIWDRQACKEIEVSGYVRHRPYRHAVAPGRMTRAFNRRSI